MLAAVSIALIVSGTAAQECICMFAGHHMTLLCNHLQGLCPASKSNKENAGLNQSQAEGL